MQKLEREFKVGWQELGREKQMTTQVPEKMVGSEEKGRRRGLGLDRAPPTVRAAFQRLGTASVSGSLCLGRLPSFTETDFPRAQTAQF